MTVTAHMINLIDVMQLSLLQPELTWFLRAIPPQQRPLSAKHDCGSEQQTWVP